MKRRLGDGRFAVRGGLLSWALRSGLERAERPVGIALRGRPHMVSHWVERGLHVRVVAGSSQAPAVVLVHGVVVSGRYLLPLAAELAGEADVLVPDLPGHGLSRGTAAPPDLAALADAVMNAAAALGHERVVLVGNSFGAQVVVEAALRHPQRVARLVLIGPTVDPGARSLVRQAGRWLRCVPDEHPSVLPVLVRDVVDVGIRQGALRLQLMLADRIEDKLPHVHCPALVVRGERDRVTPARWAQRVAGLLPAGRLVTVPGYAHMPHYSGVLAVARLLRAFL